MNKTILTILSSLLIFGCITTSTNPTDYFEYSCETLEEKGNQRAKRYNNDLERISKDKVIKAIFAAMEIKNCN